MSSATSMSNDELQQLIREHWQRAAHGWERWEPVLLYTLAAVDPVLFRALDLRPGYRVLDLACGTGEPALAMAQFVGPRGHVDGVDVSPQMLTLARERARLRRIRNARFRRGDIDRLKPPEKRYDSVVSRFGIFFAGEMIDALERVRSCLKPRGRAAFAVWGPLEKNASWTVRAEALRPWVNEDDIDPESGPHPMRLARPGLLPRLMRKAGFKRVRAEEVAVPFVLPSADDYWEMTVATSATLGRLMRSLSRAEQQKVRQRVVRFSKSYRDRDSLRFPGMAWVVSGGR
jgi:ubiquinone/menaquinone biosynthesis C-methylase UbiE